MTTHKKEVVVVCGDRVVRVTAAQWDAVIDMAGQMRDDQVQYGIACGNSMQHGLAALRALTKLERATK